MKRVFDAIKGINLKRLELWIRCLFTCMSTVNNNKNLNSNMGL